METRLAIWKAEALFIETGRTWTFFRWAWPEDAVLSLDLFVRNAPVVPHSAFAAEAQFVEDFSYRMEVEELSLTQAPCKLADDLPVLACFTGGIDGLVILDNT